MQRRTLIALIIATAANLPTATLAGNGNGQGNGGGGNGNNGNGNNGNGNSGGNGKANGRDAPTPASPPAGEPQSDADQALAAVRSGEALPLARIIEIAGSQIDGVVIDAVLVRNGAKLIYQLQILDKDGISRRLYFSARDGATVRAP